MTLNPQDASGSPRASEGGLVDSDRPLSLSSEDRYGFSRTVVPRLIDLCLRWPSDAGAVIALVGRWGSGKTSVLQMARGGLADEAGGVVLSFSPWTYEDPSTLTMAFFGTLKHHLAGSEDPVLKQVGSFVGRMGVALGTAASGLQLGGVSYDTSKLGEAKSRWERNEALVESYGEVESALREAHSEAARALQAVVRDGRRIVVLLDDVDRLSRREIKTLFRLIRAIADLPGVTLVVAMDEMRVRELLRHDLDDRFGPEYLDKIVQARLHVPAPSRALLRAHLTERLEGLLEALHIEYPDALRPRGFWTSKELRLVESALASPRDVIRFTNAMAVLMSGPGGEQIDVVDATLLTALDVSMPDAYQLIWEHRDMFLEDTGLWAGLADRDKWKADRKKRLDRIFSSLPSEVPEEVFREFLDAMFGDLMIPVRERVGSSSSGRGIREPAHFETYFLAASPRMLSVSFTKHLIAWILLEEGDPVLEGADPVPSLDTAGVDQLYRDVVIALAGRPRLAVGESVARVCELAVRIGGQDGSNFAEGVIAQTLAMRIEAAEAEWAAVVEGFRAQVPELRWIAVLREALSGGDRPSRSSVVRACEGWLQAQQELLNSGGSPGGVDDQLVDWVVEVRLLAGALSGAERRAQLTRMIGAWVARQPMRLPVVLRSVAVSSGDWVGLRGRVIVGREVLEAVAGHFPSRTELEATVSAWAQLRATNDPHGLVAELRLILAEEDYPEARDAGDSAAHDPGASSEEV